MWNADDSRRPAALPSTRSRPLSLGGGRSVSTTTDQRAGLLYGLAAYGLWGVLPLYWHLLESTSPGEVLAHRMVWSLPTALVLLAVLRRWSWIRPLLRQPKRLGLVAVAAAA